MATLLWHCSQCIFTLKEKNPQNKPHQPCSYRFRLSHLKAMVQNKQTIKQGDKVIMHIKTLNIEL